MKCTKQKSVLFEYNDHQAAPYQQKKNAKKDGIVWREKKKSKFKCSRKTVGHDNNKNKFANSERTEFIDGEKSFSFFLYILFECEMSVFNVELLRFQLLFPINHFGHTNFSAS